MSFINSKRNLLLLIAFLMCDQAHAWPQQIRHSQFNKNAEAQDVQSRELPVLKNSRLSRLQSKKTDEDQVAEKNAQEKRREILRSTFNLRKNERPLERANRLSPEERIALRRQIRQARIDIYQRRIESKDE
ncbi:hypothetical protein H8K52_01875 [Undibacterium seohonense]|uniref:Uncharacterized protein n=1 Tax=Undibacterium seohonense TaxID=1344950 RepID=A0ABR6WZG6_9BURK|nr:hypothetical protein [Undibacterium seohonense]MBC3806090.1 hypothetical protein [Undibacterium seohonense]